MAAVEFIAIVVLLLVILHAVREPERRKREERRAEAVRAAQAIQEANDRYERERQREDAERLAYARKHTAVYVRAACAANVVFAANAAICKAAWELSGKREAAALAAYDAAKAAGATEKETSERQQAAVGRYEQEALEAARAAAASVSSQAPASVLPLHLDDRAHPGMDAALEMVIAFGERAHLRFAARSDVRRYQALGSGCEALVKRRDLPAAKVRDLGEGMDPAAPVSHHQAVVGFNLYIRRIDLPRLMSDDRRRERRRQLGAELGQVDVAFLAHAPARRRPARVSGIAVVPQEHHRCLIVVRCGR